MVVFLLTAQDNDRVHRLWGGWLPELAPDEGILEGIYTAETHRGLGVMADAGTRIAESYQEAGVRYMLGFIRVDNPASIRGAEKGGWTPHLMRVERWFLFRRTITFTPWNGELAGDARQAQVA
jgi:L-amino acid N-acyltransferase YncA